MADALSIKRSVPVRHASGIYWRALAAHIRSVIEYPADLWIMASAGAVWNVLQFAFLAVLFANIPNIEGWGFHEMLMLSGLLSVAGGANALCFDGAWNTGSMVIKGDIDYRITRPAPVILQVGSSHIGLQSFGELALGFAMLVYGWIGAGVGMAWIPVGALAIVSAALIQTALVTALCAVNFWIKSPMSIFAFLLIQLQGGAMKLPLGVFPAAVRIVSLFIVPVAFINVVPVAVLTGHMNAWWLVGTPVAAVAAVALAAGVYRLGLRAYDSAGH
ncbi:ABC-2 family transporter protein [Glycomyces luteolus]|uniref:ABC-2 family transporter protein n=1 Tax=Glycomyces luteolus TaxID=2670330 RepID=A0A9X3PK13_9ACTN|nr:ABC-2 family transporter protein [Glycomyces luteolus]MDA1359960.1 ABC-2 family transporter protein [Glycomyces luteolus]